MSWRQLFPRQSATSSDGAATTSSSGVTTPGTTSSTSSDTTLSNSASATSQASGPSSSSTSTAAVSSNPSSGSAALTSSSTRATSSSQSPLSSGSTITNSSDSSPSSHASTSSSFLSSTAPSSSPAPPPSATQPSASSSQPGTPTTVTSSYTTFINGSQVITQTSYPSTIPAGPGPSTSSNRAAIIGGSAAGGTALLILLLSLAFCTRRKRFKRLDFLDAITRNRKRIHSRATLLDGEDLAEVGLQRPPRRHTDYETPWDASHSRDGSDRALMAGRATPGTPQTTTRPSRWSEAGSAFKEEVWHQPHESTRLMDPLANTDDLDGLSRIVDDVMGPSPTAAHYSDRSVSSMYRDSMAGSDGAPHSRTVSNASNAALLDAAGLGGTSGTGMGSPLTTAPVRSSPLAHPGTKPGSSEHQSEDAS